MDLNLNTDDLDEIAVDLNSVNGELNSLMGSMNSIDFDGVELTSIEAYEEAKSSINNIINGNSFGISINDLINKVNNIKMHLLDTLKNVKSWFDILESFSFEKFLDFRENIGQDNLNDNSVNVDLNEYLLNKYGNCQKLVNGGYKVKNNQGQIFYFSDDCVGKDVNFVAYYPGGASDLHSVCPAIEKSAIPSGTIIALANSTVDGFWNTNCEYNYDYQGSLFGQFDNIMSDLKVNLTGVQTIGFSSGGLCALPFARMNQCLRKHSSVKDYSIVIVDGGDQARLFTDSFPCDMLVEKEVPVYLLSSSSAQKSGVSYASLNEKAAKRLSEHGLETHILYHNNVIIHQALNEKLFSSGLYRFLSGESTVSIKSTDYTVYEYNNGVYKTIDNFFTNKTS